MRIRTLLCLWMQEIACIVYGFMYCTVVAGNAHAENSAEQTYTGCAWKKCTRVVTGYTHRTSAKQYGYCFYMPAPSSWAGWGVTFGFQGTRRVVRTGKEGGNTRGGGGEGRKEGV